MPRDVTVDGTRMALTTDSFVVTPLRFPGGSIGELAVNGTVNDLAVSGARAIALVTTFVLEAGLPTRSWRQRCARWRPRPARAGVAIVGGDTRWWSTARPTGCTSPPPALGGTIPGVSAGRALGARRATRCCSPGPIGDHGITILLARGELDLEADLRSDTRSVLPLVEALAAAAGAGHFAGCGIPPAAAWRRRSTNWRATAAWRWHLVEEQIPMRDEVRGACELLGLDPLHIANEGQFLAVVAAGCADAALAALQRDAGRRGGAHHRRGAGRSPPPRCWCDTRYGGSRIVDMLVGDPLPRIC